MAGAAEFVLGLNPVIQREGHDLVARAQPLARYLAHALGLPVRLVVEPDYDAQIAAMRARAIDAAFFGEYAFQRAQAEAGAEALAVSVEEGSETAATYQSVVIARADSPVRTLADLKGREVGFVDRGSTAGYLIPRRMLREAGLDPDADITPIFLHSHRAVLDAVLDGTIPAGALYRTEVRRLAERDPAQADTVRTVAISPPVPKGPFAVRKGLDRETRQRLLQALLRVHDEAPDAAAFTCAAGNRWRPASNRSVTLKTVAALSGVSYGTVSRVINGRAHVAPETYARVMSIVQDLGFRPNAAAVSLIANRSDLVGFVVPDADDPMIARYVAGIRRTLADLDLHLVLCPTGGSRDEEAHYLGLLDDGRFGGMLLTEWSLDTPLVGTLAATGRPLVLLGASGGSAPVPSVAPDWHALCAAAVGHLRALGHARVGALVAPALISSIERACADAGCDPDRALIVAAPPATGDEAACRLLALPARPTAIIAETERAALALYDAAADANLAVPNDLSILALDASWLAAAMRPTLTTVTLSFDALGAHAAALLVEQMSGGERVLPALAVPAPAVVARASTTARTPQ